MEELPLSLPLPIELVIEILALAIGSSPATSTYRSLLLVCHQFHQIAESHCLRVVPICLEGYHQLQSFEHLLLAKPWIRPNVRFLWIMGEGLTCWALIKSILLFSTNIVRLSCTSRSLITLCTPLTFKHTECTDLTLVEKWHAWNEVIGTVHGPRLCAQITHLRMHEGLSPEFPRHHFTALSHLAFSSRPIKDYIARHLAALEPVVSIRHLVITTFWWRDDVPDALTSKSLLELDTRLSFLHCRKGWSELGTWQAGVAGGINLWEQARVEKRSMKVFRGGLGRLLKI